MWPRCAPHCVCTEPHGVGILAPLTATPVLACHAVYVPTEEERARDAQQAKLSAAIAAVVVLGPIALVAALAAQQ